MPNWCMNKITLAASREEIDRVASAAYTGTLLNALRPEPEHVEDSSDHMPAWWCWRTENWGTKWDVGTIPEWVSDSCIVLRVDTAWSPPIEALEYWAETCGGTFEAMYYEPGMGYAGIATHEGTAQWPILCEEDADKLPQDLVEEFNMYQQFEEYA